MSIFQAREWWSVDNGEASVQVADDRVDFAGHAAVENGASAADGEEDSDDALHSVTVRVSPFASTMGNQVRTSKVFRLHNYVHQHAFIQADVIVCGSLGGLLRIYSPYRPDPDLEADGPSVGATASTADNLLLEMQMPEPILQLEIGRLSTS